MIRAALLLLALTTAATADDIPYPSGTVTRTYVGGTTGIIGIVPVDATARAEITATPQSFAHPSGNVFVVRGMFTRAPSIPETIELTNWSNLIAVHASGDYVRARAAWGDGAGAVVASWPADWSEVTLEASGEVTGIPVTLNRTTMVCVETFTNGAVADIEAAPLDAIDASKISIIGKHKMDPAKAAVTRKLYSAKIEGGKVRLSFDPLGWPTESSKGKTCDGGVCIVWPEGEGYVGGWFDHHKVGQTVKTMANIPEGYVGGRQPPPGPVWFYMISYDGRQRTTIVSGGTW